jgi:phosphoribosylamine--glycine ligase
MPAPWRNRDRSSNGGRVLAINATGDTLHEAVDRAYAAVNTLEWPDGFCRRDIGKKALFF